MGCTVSAPPPTPRQWYPVQRQLSISTVIKFSSDSVDIVVDNRQDQHPVVDTEQGYPEPCPYELGSDEVRDEPPWFESGSEEYDQDDDLDLHDIETLKREDSRISLSVSPKGHGMVATRRKKVSFTEIDEHAKKANRDLLQSFSDLIGFLTEPISDVNINKEILTARAIVVWMSVQNIEQEDYGEPTTNTPAGLLQCIKEDIMTYATCYTRLCRKAKLKCTLVHGLVKAGGYRLGDDQAPSSLWTAVYADGSWQIVHPFWICKAMYGESFDGWVKIDANNSTREERDKVSEGVIKDTFKEYYFMPKPHHFIYECFAEDVPWQLLHEMSSVKTKEEFLSLPYLLPPFFGLGLELVSEKNCPLVAIDGICVIIIKSNPIKSHKFVLRYELFKKAPKGSNKKYVNDSITPKMVFNSRANEWFQFCIRFKEPGEYKFILYGGPVKSPSLRLGEFQILCQSVPAPCILYPLACDKIGWGPGPSSLDAGLLVPSKPSGSIKITNNKDRTTDITFKLGPGLRNDYYDAYLYNSDGSQSSDCVTCTIIGNDLLIRITLPCDGEFGLEISHTKRSMAGSEKIVCNYLIQVVEPGSIRTQFRLAKKRLLEACAGTNFISMSVKLKAIRAAVDWCLNQKVEEYDEDVSSAQVQLIYLFLKNELRDAILRGHLGVAKRTLALVARYKYKGALRNEVRQVQKMAKLRVAHNK